MKKFLKVVKKDGLTKMSRLVYKGIRKIIRIVKNAGSYVRTYIKFYVFDVKFKKINTKGTPVVEACNGCIKIGENFRMNNGLAANTIGFATPCVLVANCANLVLGNNVGISQTVLFAYGADITIGNNVLMGGGVKIYSTDFHSLDYINRRKTETDGPNRKSAPVFIGNDVFIGAGAIILKGVSIGDRSIIGAGSVVTKSIPSDCIAAGNPCNVIRFLKENL